MAKVSWCKLYSGAWGIRVKGKVSVGDELEVENRRGGTRDVVVASIEWSEGKESVCGIEADEDESDDDEDAEPEKPTKRVKRAGKSASKAKASYIVYRGKKPASVEQRGKVTYIRLEE